MIMHFSFKVWSKSQSNRAKLNCFSPERACVRRRLTRYVDSAAVRACQGPLATIDALRARAPVCDAHSHLVGARRRFFMRRPTAPPCAIGCHPRTSPRPCPRRTYPCCDHTDDLTGTWTASTPKLAIKWPAAPPRASAHSSTSAIAAAVMGSYLRSLPVTTDPLTSPLGCNIPEIWMIYHLWIFAKI
jgi:hypothetical protein